MKRHPDSRQWSTDVDLDWLAFCYVAGELPVEEAQAFERRLAVDPAVCESLSAAVELAQLSALALDAAALDTATLDTATLDTAALDTAALDTAALDTAALDTAARDTAARDTVGGRGPIGALDAGSAGAARVEPAGTYALAAGSVADAGSLITAAGGRLSRRVERVRRGRRWRYAAWLSCGALAGIGLTLAFVGARGGLASWGGLHGAQSVSTGTNGRGSAARVQVQQLAMAWAQGRATEHGVSESQLALVPGLELPDGGLLPPEPWAAEQPAPVSEWAGDSRGSPYDESWAGWSAGSAEGWPAGDDALSLQVPSWMVTAVSQQERQDVP